jgi:HEAT repeat protein
MLVENMDTADVIAALDAPTEDRRGVVKQLEVEAQPTAMIGALVTADRAMTRQLAADILGRRADAEAASALVAALRDQDPGVRASAADALGKVMLAHGPDSAPEAGPALLAAYGGEHDAGVRHMLIAALGAAGHREAIPLLRAAAASEDRGLALAARWALDRLA